MNRTKLPNNPFRLGVSPLHEGSKKGIYVAFELEKEFEEKEVWGILLYDKKTGACIKKHVFPEKNRIGRICYDVIEDVDRTRISYLFFAGDRIFTDKYAHSYKVLGKYGELKAAEDYKALLPAQEYDWEDSVKPEIPYEDSILYCLHVRGFTKHITSGVKAKGTFAGIAEKISYLKALGVTGIELQPCYEFDEIVKQRDSQKTKTNQKISEKYLNNPGHREDLLVEARVQNEWKSEDINSEKIRLNYWGYLAGFYYAPKSAYAYTKNPVKEFKDLVKNCHQSGMEVILQFYFPDEISGEEISRVLRHWSFYYQVDGFHLMGSRIPVQDLATDPYLSEVKLMYYDFPVDALYPEAEAPKYRNLAVYEDSYFYSMRRFLKGEEGVIPDIMYRIRRNPQYTGVINYLTNYYGFTMMDLVSYNYKHNEENGENNEDGNDYNASWNCGAEGKTRKKEVLTIREQQYRNAFTMLLLSQGTPLFFMGDEFGNSQKGNNNPYCQDNPVTWLNWNDLKKNKGRYEFVKQLIELRKNHKIFHMSKECTLMDYLSCGYPDLSYHNEQAWRPELDKSCRHIAFMLCGQYAPDEEKRDWYVAMNMHWEERDFAMPKLPKGRYWEEYFTTEMEIQAGEITKEQEKNTMKKTVPGRSVVVYRSKKQI